MPYVVVKTNGQEVDRRELAGPMVIGRARGCTIVIHDILLSRRHCLIEETPRGWELTDLNSKNGTKVNAEKISGPRLLDDKDAVRIGRSKIVFHAGVMEEAPAASPNPARPADPGDSLSGMLTGFAMLEPGQGKADDDVAVPRPVPRDPDSLRRAEVRELLTALASSSWDSIYMEASRKRGDLPPSPAEADVQGRSGPRARPRSPIDLSLQATPMAAGELGEGLATSGISPILPAAPAAEVPGFAAMRDKPVRRRSRWKRFIDWPRRRLGVGAAILLAVGITQWPRSSPPVLPRYAVAPSPAPIASAPAAQRRVVIEDVDSLDDLNLPIVLPVVSDLAGAQIRVGTGNAAAREPVIPATPIAAGPPDHW